MRSRGIRLAKEDSMVVEGPILTANSHGDKFLCNTNVIYTLTTFFIKLLCKPKGALVTLLTLLVGSGTVLVDPNENLEVKGAN